MRCTITPRHRLHRHGLAFLAAGLLACTDPVAPVDIGGVEAVARAGTIELTNWTDRPVFTFVIGRELAARALWAPCVDATQCPPIPPGGQRRTPAPAGEREALVHWWYAVEGPDGTLRPDSIRVGIVRLEH